MPKSARRTSASFDEVFPGQRLRLLTVNHGDSARDLTRSNQRIPQHQPDDRRRERPCATNGAVASRRIGEPAQIQERIREFLAAHCHVSAETIDDRTRFEEDLGLDSFDVVELLIHIEDAYGVIINDADAAQLATVEQATNFIAARLQELDRTRD